MDDQQHKYSFNQSIQAKVIFCFFVVLVVIIRNQLRLDRKIDSIEEDGPRNTNSVSFSKGLFTIDCLDCAMVIRTLEQKK